MVTNLDIIDKLAFGNHNTCTFVATNQGQFSVEWPVTASGMKISSSGTRQQEIDHQVGVPTCGILQKT